MPRGRKPLPPEVKIERANARLALKRNVTLSPEAQELLQRVQDKMEADLGFRPSQSQVVARLVKLYADTHGD